MPPTHQESDPMPNTISHNSARRALLWIALATAALAVLNAPSSTARSKPHHRPHPSPPGRAGGSPSPADTKVVAFIPAGVAEVSPGLCNPGDTPWCINAPQDQVHIYTLVCNATGTFEGHQLPPGSPCAIDLTAFMDPSTGFAT